VTIARSNPQTGTIAIQGASRSPGTSSAQVSTRGARSCRNAKGSAARAAKGRNELQGAYQIGVVAADGKVEVRTVRTGIRSRPGVIRRTVFTRARRSSSRDSRAVRPGMLVRAVPAARKRPPLPPARRPPRRPRRETSRVRSSSPARSWRWSSPSSWSSSGRWRCSVCPCPSNRTSCLHRFR